MEPIAELEDKEEIDCDFDSCSALSSCFSQTTRATATATPKKSDLNTEKKLDTKAIYHNNNSDKNIIKMNNNTDCDTNEQPLNSSSMCNSQNQSNQQEQQQEQQQNKQNNMNQNSQFRSRSYTWPHLSSQNDESNCESSGIYGVDDDDDMIPMISNIGQLNSHYDHGHHLNAYTDPDDLMLPMLIGMTMPNSNASTINGNVSAPNDSCWSNNHSVAQAAYSFGETLLPMANQMQQQHLYPLARNSVSNNNGNSSQSNDNHVSTSIQYANSNGNNRVTSTANNNRNNDTSVSALMSSDQQAYFDGTIANKKNINNNKNNHDANHNDEQYSSLTADVNPTTISTTAITTTMPSVGQQQQQQPNGGQYIQRQRSGSNQHAHQQQQQQQPKQNPEQSSQPSQTSSASASATATANNKKNTSRRNAWGNMSYADLITQAINGSVDKRLTLSQIYEWMVQNVHYFKDKGDSNSSAGWKNSIRHNLSLHNRFMRVQNEGTGKSSWWMINPDAKPGKAARRRAISMETQNYEKRRGRVKKRVEQLRAAQAANALTGPAAGIGENVSLSTLSEYGPPLMKSSSSEINLATGLMSPSSFKHQPQHFLSSSGGVLHHSKNLSRASNASLSNLNLSDPISTGLNNNNSHILVTSPSSTESFDLYSESSLLIGPCSSSSHYIHHPNSYSPNEFRPRASSNASSTCSNLLIDSSDNNQVSTLWYGSNGSSLNNPNASYNTSTDAYTPSNMDSSLQMIECLHLDADSSPHQTYQTIYMDDPQTSAASEAEPPPSSSSSSQISINLQSSKPSKSTTSNQNNQQNIGTDGNAVNNGHNGLSGSNSKSSSSSNNNNNNNSNNSNAVRPNSYHDLFNRLQPNTSTSITSPSTTTTANKQQQVSNKKCQNNHLKLGINIDNVNSNLDDGDADANNLNQSTPNYYKSAATISPTNNKDVNDCLSDTNKDPIDCNNDTNIDGAKCNVQLNNGIVHDNINNSQNQNCNNNGHPKVANNGTSGDSSGQYSGADEPLSYHAMQQSLSLPLSLSSSSSSSPPPPPSSSLLMHQTKMQPYNDLYGVATSVNRISDNNANHHSASASEDGGGYGMTPPSSYYHQMSYQHHAHHPNNDSTIACEMGGGDSNAHNSNSNIDIDFMMPIVADDTIRNNNNHNNSQALLNLSDPMIFDLSESQQQHNRQQLALEESEDTSTNQCPPLVAQQPQDSMDELINSYTNSSHQQSAYSSASASGNGAGGVGGSLQQLPNHGHMQSHQPHSYVSYVEGRFEKNPHHYVLSQLEHQQLQQHSQQPPFPSISGHHQYHPISMENNQRISTGSGDGNNNAQQSGPTSAAATGTTTTTSHPVASRSWVH